MKAKEWFKSLFKNKKLFVAIVAVVAALVVATVSIVAIIASKGNGSGNSNVSSSSSGTTPDVEYTVSFDTVGGSSIESVTVAAGKKVVEPAIPTKNGFKFGGWYTDKDYREGSKYQFNTPVTGNITLYARWLDTSLASEPFTISFELNYTGKSLAPQETVGGYPVDLPIPEREGYIFNGWWVSMYDDGNKLSYELVETMEVKESLTVYALWTTETTREPIVDVQKDKITWILAEGEDDYCRIEVNGPDGFNDIYRSTSAKQWEVDFANAPAGDYVVKVTCGKGSKEVTTTRYYKNKALPKVSNFSILEGDDNYLVYNAVEGAEEYLISVECGDVTHKHEAYNNGGAVGYDFSGCQMGDDGIRFTVTAVAEGYAESVSKTYVLNRTLDSVGTCVVDTNEVVSWNAVDDASEYVVTIKSADTTETVVVNGTTYSLKGYAAGTVAVSVYPTNRTYKSGVPVSVEYQKQSLATPTEISVDGNVLKWNATGATAYKVYVTDEQGNEKTFETTTNELTLSEGTHYASSASSFKVEIVAVGGAKDSQRTDAMTIANKAIEKVTYNKNTITWTPVLGAEGYEVRVNNGTVVKVDKAESSAVVALTKSGDNVVEVRYQKAGTSSDWAQCTVTAYAVKFDACGGDEADTQYLATGDVIELPETYQTGYVNNGWFSAPNGAAVGAMNYQDGVVFTGMKDTTVYASWTGKKYTVTYNYADPDNVLVTNKKEGEEIAFDASFTLDAPVSNDESLVFTGWYSEPLGSGTKYTDDKGVGFEDWAISNDTTVYAHWAEVFEFVKLNDGTYAVKQGKDLRNADYQIKEITIPETYMGEKVTVVSGEAFNMCTRLEVINIPDTIQVIETDNSFDRCDKLQEVNIYETAGTHERLWSSSDGMLVFKDNVTGEYSLKFVPVSKTGSITIPNTVTEIPTNVFAGEYDSTTHNRKVEEVVIPSSVRVIQVAAFKNCKNLKSVRFLPVEEGEETVSLEIKDKAFQNCLELAEINLPARLGNVSLDMFYGCESLSNIHVEEGGTTYSSKDGALCSVNGDTLMIVPIGRAGVYTVPSGVTTIAEQAFAGCKRITEVVIPFEVKTISDYAFVELTYNSEGTRIEKYTGLRSLVKVTFQGGSDLGQTIGDYAFAYNQKLSNVVFAEGSNVTEIGRYAFYNTAIKVLNIPNTVQSVGGYAFADCADISSVIIEEGGNLAFGEYVFQNCVALKKFDMPASVTQIELALFAGCSNLERVEVADENPNYMDVDGVLFTKDEKELLFYPVGRKGAYVIPEKVEKIGATVFQNNHNLTEVTLGKNVVLVDEYAFDGCYNLSRVEISAEGGDLTLKPYAFANCIRLTNIVLPARVKAIPEGLFSASSSLVNVTIQGEVTSLGAYSFANTGVATLNLPATVTTLGDYVFAGSEIKNIEIPASITSIGKYAFYRCKSLQSVTFADASQVKTIPQYAFAESTVVTVEIPASVTKIDNYAFDAAANLTTVTFEGTSKLTTTGTYVFRYCTALETFAIPDSVTSLGNYSFQYAYNLKSVTFGENSKLKTIGNYAFAYTSLKSFTIPKATTSIGTYVFNYCRDLKKVDYVAGSTESTLTIGNYAFGNTGLETISLPKRVSSLNTQNAGKVSAYSQNVFPNSYNLKAINIEEGGSTFKSINGIVYSADGNEIWLCPIGYEGEVTVTKNITVIRSAAFVNCIKLTKVIFEELGEGETGSLRIGSEGVTSSSYGAFYKCFALTEATLPKHTIDIGTAAFYNCACLEKIVIPARVKAIGSQAFNGCGAETIVFEKNADGSRALETIAASSVFGYSNALKSVVIPKEIKVLENQTFAYSPNLTSVTFEEGSQLNELKSSVFANTGLTEIDLPDSLTYCSGTYVFMGTNITEITIPAGIDDFSKLISGMDLTAIHVKEGHKFFYSQDGIVYNNTDNTVAFRPTVVVGGEGGATEFRIPDGTTSIAEEEFDSSSYTKIIIPGSVTRIGDGAFQFSSVEEIVFEEGQDDLVFEGTGTFFYSNLKKITFPKRVSQVAGSMFGSCSNLESIVFEKGSRVKELPSTFISTNCVALKEVVLPDSLEGVLPNFSDCNALERLVVPEGVTTIIDRGFSYATTNSASYTQDACYALEEIILPSTLETIGNFAFQDCKALKRIVIPKNVTEIGTDAFAGCESLEEVVFEEGSTLAEIKEYTFSSCPKLVSINIPTSVGKIGEGAFGNANRLLYWEGNNKNKPRYDTTKLVQNACESLGEISLSDSVTEIGAHAFDGATKMSLAKDDLPSDLMVLGEYAFNGCENLATKLTVPATITVIAPYAFAGCKKVASVELYNSLVEIGDYAFKGCTNITALSIPKSVGIIGKNPFMGCNGIQNAELIDGETMILENGVLYDLDKTVIYAFFSNTITEYEVPETVRQIGAGAFAGTSLEKITFNEDLISIGENAFANCTALKTVNFNEGFTTIGDNAFEGCTALTEVKLPDSLRTIGNKAFYGAQLNKLHVGANVTVIGQYAFAEMTALSEVTFEQGGAEGLAIANYAFYKCTALQEITIPRRVSAYLYTTVANPTASTTWNIGDAIGDYAFSGCTSLKKVTFDESGLTKSSNLKFTITLGDYAFENCTSLTTMHFPSYFGFVPPADSTKVSTSWNDFGKGAFSGCTLLESLTFDEPKYQKIAGNIFENCTSLKSFEFPETVSSGLGASTFKGCISLTSVKLPSRMTSLGTNAFENTGITTIELPEGISSIPDSCFAGCTKLESIVIPEAVTAIRQYAFYNCSSLTSIKIPSALQAIGESYSNTEDPSSGRYREGWTFAGCTALTEIVLPVTVEQVQRSEFEGWTASQTIKILGRKVPGKYWEIDEGSAWYDGCQAKVVWGYQPEQE